MRLKDPHPDVLEAAVLYKGTPDSGSDVLFAALGAGSANAVAPLLGC